jgi:hypothetical protein
MTAGGKKIWYAFAFLVLLAYCLAEASGTGDLLIYLSAAADLDHHAEIYEKTYLDGYHYYYSVLFALLLKPLWLVPYFATRFAWIAFNAVLYLLVFRLMSRSEFVQVLPPKKKNLFLAGTFLFSLRFLHENLHASQVTILILFFCVFGLRYITNGKPLKGAALLAAGINLKLLPLFFIPYLIYRGHFKAVLFVIIWYAAFMVLPFVFIDPGYYTHLLQSWWRLINPSNQEHVLDVAERSFHGLSTLLSTLLVEKVPDLYALNMRRNIADIPLASLSAVLMLVRATLAALTLYFLRWPPFLRVSPTRLVIEISYILLLIPLLFPHQQHYAFLFSVPAFAVCWYYLLINYNSLSPLRRNGFAAALVFIYLTANLKILLGEFNQYYEHYKILTYGALMLIPLLIRVSGQQRLSGS